MTNNEDLKKTEISISTRVLVVGSGPVAVAAARELSKIGREVILCSHDEKIVGNPHLLYGRYNMPADPASLVKDIEADPMIRVLSPAEILEFDGSPGNFQVRLRTNGGMVQTEVGAVMLANEPLLASNFDAWGVSESEKIRSLSWLESALSSSDTPFLSQELPLKVVFLCGFTHHSNPYSQMRAVEAALKLISKRGNQVFFLTEHFKVAYTGMERLTRKAREAGVLFVKFSGTSPDLKYEKEHTKISYFDETIGGDVLMNPDLLVLEESYKPSPETAPLAEKLGITLDQEGFFQGENIHNQPIYTNRIGVWVVGSAKGPVSLEEGMEEAGAAALDVHRFLAEGKRVIAENRISLDRKKCTICLTCYRLCPHGAISYLDRRPVFSDLACMACGICAAECPMDAIQIYNFSDQQLKLLIQDMTGEKSGVGEAYTPVLVAFCCQNSAFEAADLAALRGFKLPEGLKLIKVPCAGRIDTDYLLTAFRTGADGVMVLGCHHESCKSMKGSDLAEWRVEAIRESLEESGLEKERLFFGSLAPGMSSEFVKIAKEMEETVRGLGGDESLEEKVNC